MVQGLAAGDLTETLVTERSESAQLSGANPNPFQRELTAKRQTRKPRVNQKRLSSRPKVFIKLNDSVNLENC
jgi:hypothetical protein